MAITHEGHTDGVNSVAFSPDGKSIVSGSGDDTVRTWDANSSSPIAKVLRGHYSYVYSVSYSPLGNLIASGSKDGTIRLWDPSTGKKAGEALTGDHTFVSVAFSPDAKLIASGCAGLSYSPAAFAIQLWDVKTRKAASGPFKGHTDSVWSVSFSPDRTRLVSGSDDKTIRVWDVERKSPLLGPLEGHTYGVHSVGFSPDSAQIVSCSVDRTIRLWDPRTGQPIGNPYTGHTASVWSVSFSPRGTYIASGSSDTTVRLWDVRTGHQVGQPFEEHIGRVTSVAFSPCGQFVASGSDDRKVIIRRVLDEAEYPAADNVEPQEVTSAMEVSDEDDPDGNLELQMATNQALIQEARKDSESDNDVEPQIVDTVSLIRDVLNPPVSPLAESVVAPGVPFLGLETGLKTLSNMEPKKEAIAIQSQSIEAELPGLKGDLTERQDANTSRIRPILQAGQNLKEEALDLELQVRKANDPELDFIDRANEILNEVEELLQLIHMPNARADSSHRPLLDMSLSVLAKLASSLFSMSTSSNMNSLEYFRLSKRSLMIATYYLPKVHSAKPIIASHWGTLYLLRFQLFGKNDHITQAIKFYEQSLKDVPVDYPQRAMFLASLGRSYLARFDDSQLADDLKNGIEYSSQAWKAIESNEGATPEEKKHIFEGTSRGLQCLIEHVGGSNSISLINTGIREWGNTLGDVLKNEKSKRGLKAGCMRILGFLYITRFDQAGSQNPVDLERSTAFLAAAVALLPKKHSDLLSTLCVLAHSLAAKARDEASRELALEFLKLAETLTTPAFEPHLLCSFGDLYVSLSRQADLAHLKLAIEYYNRALKHPNCPPGSRLWAKVRQNLGICGIYCYNILNTQRSPLAIGHLESALRQFIHVTLSPRGHLFDRFTAACSWASNAASHPTFRAQSLYGYETAMELIPLLVSFGAVPDQRRKATQKSGQLATEAAATAIKEKKYSTALALLEQGRSIKWNHMLQLQSPLYMLKLHPAGERPAKELEELLKGLQLGAETNASADPAGQPSLKLDGLDLQARYQQVLVTIRKIKGFANFMRPKPVSELLKAARNGPVVVINVHQSGCDALVVPQFDREHNPQPQNIPLPELRLRRITEMREAIDQSLARISNSRRSNSESDREEEKRQGTEQLKAGLKNLWYWVVDPILGGLGYKPRSADDLDPNKLPRITWCATGPLSFLPLHAAGDYDYPSRKTFEYVVSSYTPTLSALVPDPHHDVLPKHPCHILLVNPEASSGEDALPAAGTELDCIVYHYKMATGSLGKRFRPADNIEFDWSWDGAPKESNDSQARINSELSLDMDGVSDDELDPDWKSKLPKSSKSAKTPQNQGKAARYTRLDGRDASPEKVYNEMQNHDWVHFACHAVQNNGDPSKCGFSLRGKLLSLQTIARMPYEKRGLAFLSACRTAAGDQNLPDEAIHLASGMLMTGYSRVIATLWPVKDADAPFVANIVYKRLLVDEGMKCDDSAVALHVALDRLRKEPRVGLPDWISFVHFGAC